VSHKAREIGRRATFLCFMKRRIASMIITDAVMIA